MIASAPFTPLIPETGLRALDESDPKYPMGFIHRDPIMAVLLERVQTIAASDASVLICGESGTGKEVVARRIHHSSRRAKGPFIGINCAAIPEHLLEAELFGHERGAFSGAIMQRIGKLEAGHGGTILLDEITEIDRHLQPKLLRAIQEREISRLGGRSSVSLDVRIIATTNRDLKQEVLKQNFREDLYYRLNVVSIHIPNLRDRKIDIPTLANFFVQKYQRLESTQLSKAAHDALLDHDWPGNVRELENTIYRAIVLTPGRLIEPDALELASSMEIRPQRTITPHGFSGASLSSLEREAIISTLRQHKGNRTRTAAILGLSIRGLRNKIANYQKQGIEIPMSNSSRGL